MGKVTKDARIEPAGRVLRDADRAGRPSLDAARTLASSRFDGMRSGAALDADPEWFEDGARSRLGL